MLGFALPVDPAQQTRESYLKYSGCPQKRNVLFIIFCIEHSQEFSGNNFQQHGNCTIGAKIITLHNFRVLNSFPQLPNKITEFLNYFLGYVISCVVAKHTMWTSDYIS